MTLKDELGISCLKVCPDCGEIGPRIINRCPACEEKYQAVEVERKTRREKAEKVKQRRDNGFGPEWD